MLYRLQPVAMFPSCGKLATQWYLMSAIMGFDSEWVEGRCAEHPCTFEEVERSGAGFESIPYEEAIVYSVMES